MHQCTRVIRTLCQCRIQALPRFVLLGTVARRQRGGQQALQVRVVRCELHGLPRLTDGIGVILARVGSVGTLCGTAIPCRSAGTSSQTLPLSPDGQCWTGAE